MKNQDIIGLWEAYQQVHTQEEVEQLDEGMTLPDYKKKRSALKQKEKRAAAATAPTRRAGIHTPDHAPERAARHRFNVDPDFEGNDEENYPGGRLRPNKVRKAKALGELGENFDLFDYLLEYLVAEGYADTNKAALAIMANMSEEWKQNIMEISDRRVEAARNAMAKRTNRSVTSGNQYSRNVSREARMNARIQSRNERTGSNVEPTDTRRHQ